MTKTASNPLNGDTLLANACKNLEIDLGPLVAATSLWAHPKVHEYLLKENGTGAFFPGFRRANARETRRSEVNGEQLDDNTYANNAIKRCLGASRTAFKGFAVCHIWDDTCKDVRYHTAIANLVLLPRALASLSDHMPEIKAALQYRSFELYGWHPEGKKSPEPSSTYPTNWRDPFPFSFEVEAALRRRRRA